MKAYWIAAPFAACVLLAPSMAVAQTEGTQSEGAQVSEDPIVEDIPDPATLTMPPLAFADSPEHADGFKKYFYFHRADTTYQDAYRDIRECDALASGSSIYLGASEGAIAGAMANYGLLAGGIGGAVGSVIADAIFGSALRREQRRTNLRNCMSFKG